MGPLTCEFFPPINTVNVLFLPYDFSNIIYFSSLLHCKNTVYNTYIITYEIGVDGHHVVSKASRQQLTTMVTFWGESKVICRILNAWRLVPLTSTASLSPCIKVHYWHLNPIRTSGPSP